MLMIIDNRFDIHLVWHSYLFWCLCPFKQEAVKLYNQTVAQKRLLALAEDYLALGDEVRSTDNATFFTIIQFL